MLQNPHLQTALRQAEEQLGDSGRILLRESGTEPVVRIMAEAQEQKTAEKCVEYIIRAMKDEGFV